MCNCHKAARLSASSSVPADSAGRPRRVTSATHVTLGRADSSLRERASENLQALNSVDTDLTSIDERRSAVLQITPWERQTLQLLARGLPIGDIGSSLGIPVSEVGVHVTALFTKMGVTNKDDAIADARKRGLVMNS